MKRFYLPRLKRDVTKTIKRCRTCQLAKGAKQNMKLYTLPIPHKPLQDLSMDFVMGLPKIVRGHDSIFIVVDHFLKMAHFIPWRHTVDASKIAFLFFKVVVRLHSVRKTIVSDRDVKFNKLFLELWKLMETQLQFSSA